MATNWAGYNPLRKGRIHLLCPSCGRKLSNAIRRDDFDPPQAEIMHVQCEKCSQGCFDSAPFYLDARGRPVDYWKWYEGRKAPVPVQCSDELLRDSAVSLAHLVEEA